MKKIIVPTATLNHVWNSWLKDQPLTDHEQIWVFGRPYGERRCSNKQRRFEDWLFSQGGSIKRANKQFHIEFTDSSQASFFILRWG